MIRYCCVMNRVLIQLRDHARRARKYAYTPYSGEPRAAAILLSDGQWTSGVRIENVSYSLVIPAVTAAFSKCASAGRLDIVAVVISGSARNDEKAFLKSLFADPVAGQKADTFTLGPLPAALQHRLTDYVMSPNDLSAQDGITMARKAAASAIAPYSNFPVGCVIKTSSGRLYKGSNVEYEDWTRIICAERSAIAAALSDGARDMEAMYMSCLNDPAGSPCGACRQHIVELLPQGVVWMDRGASSPECAVSTALLPGAFAGRGLHPEE